MLSENIIVYDRKNFFYRFIKNKYRNSYNVIKHIDINDTNLNHNDSFFLIIFVAYDDSDIIPFINYYSSTSKIIVCSQNSEILEKYNDIDYIHLVDISLLKNSISNILDFKLEIFKIK